MSINIEVACDECGRDIGSSGSQHDDVCYCEDCWEDLKEKIEALEDRIVDIQREFCVARVLYNGLGITPTDVVLNMIFTEVELDKIKEEA